MNLYHAYMGVNAVDPDGDAVWFIPVIAYVGYNALFATAETGLEYGVNSAFGQETHLGPTFAKNFGINLLTGGIGGKVKATNTVRRLGQRAVAHYGLRQGVEIAGDTAYDVAWRGDSLGSALAVNTVGSLAGEGLARGLGAGVRAAGRTGVGQAAQAYAGGFAQGFGGYRLGGLATDPTGMGHLAGALGSGHRAGRAAKHSRQLGDADGTGPIMRALGYSANHVINEGNVGHWKRLQRMARRNGIDFTTDPSNRAWLPNFKRPWDTPNLHVGNQKMWHGPEAAKRIFKILRPFDGDKDAFRAALERIARDQEAGRF